MMTGNALLLVGRLSEVQQAVREQFQEGGSIATVLIVLVILGTIFITVFYLSIRQRRALQTTTPADPRRLFFDLANGVGLSVLQRDLLESVTRDLRLEHPAVVLLCPGSFDRHLAQWQRQRKRQPTPAKPPPDDLVSGLRDTLFPPSRTPHTAA